MREQHDDRYTMSGFQQLLSSIRFKEGNIPYFRRDMQADEEDRTLFFQGLLRHDFKRKKGLRAHCSRAFVIIK